MDEQGFKSYLDNCDLSLRVKGDYLSRCKRVEKYEGDLDQHFLKNRGSNLLDKLTYTKEDQQKELEPAHSIKITGTKGYESIYNGTASLRNAVSVYFEYLKGLNKLNEIDRNK